MRDLTKLRQLAKAAASAAPGTWESDREYMEDAPNRHYEFFVIDGSGNRMFGTENSDAGFGLIEAEYDEDGSEYAWNEPARKVTEFIVAAQPTSVLALLDRLERAEAEAKRIYQVKLSDDQAFANEVAKLHALLADAGKALEPFASEAFVWRSPDDYAVVVVGCGADEYPSFCVGHLRAARNVATKIEEALK